MRRAAAAPASVAAFTGADVAANHHRHVASTDVFLADQHNVGRLHHRVGCLDRSDETFGLDHSQGFEWHAGGTLTDGEWVVRRDPHHVGSAIVSLNICRRFIPLVGERRQTNDDQDNATPAMEFVSFLNRARRP
jgi:hypothetical protein